MGAVQRVVWSDESREVAVENFEFICPYSGWQDIDKMVLYSKCQLVTSGRAHSSGVHNFKWIFQELSM